MLNGDVCTVVVVVINALCRQIGCSRLTV